jgi:hypothetical protein
MIALRRLIQMQFPKTDDIDGKHILLRCTVAVVEWPFHHYSRVQLCD